MQTFTNEPPEDLGAFLKNLKLYADRSLKGDDNSKIRDILRQSSCNIVKTGNWGSRWGYAEAKIIFTIPIEQFELIDGSIKHKMIVLSDTLLQGTNCGLEISDIDFIPKMDTETPTIEQELNEIIFTNEQVVNKILLPDDLISKGKQMSEAYLYIYFVENYLRIFIEKIQVDNQLAYPREVKNTIEKNKANEQQNKFLPLRGNSALYYCDFVQLQQIIIGNWEVFKTYFPHQDQHWLRVKIEDMYRVRNLIAHCGYVSSDELGMVKANFKMIIGQLKF